MTRDIKAKSAVYRIFNLPPSSLAELKQILSNVDVEFVREEIFERVEQGGFDEADFAIFAEVIQEIGVGAHREHLVSLVLDEGGASLVRKYALVALTQDAGDDLAVDLGHLGPEVLQNLTDLPFVDLMYRLQMDPDEAGQVTVLLEASQEESRAYVLSGLEKIRKDLGVPATIVYGDALRSRELEEIYPEMLDSIVDEGAEDGLFVLPQLRDAARSKDTQKLFQRALLRLGTKNIEKPKSSETQRGSAYLGSCDGQGAYLLIGRFRVSRKNTATVHLCIRCAGEVRDAFVLPMLDENEFESTMEKLFAESPGEFVEISLEHALVFVDETLERMEKNGGKIERRDRYAIDLFRKTQKSCSLPWLDGSVLSRERTIEKFMSVLSSPLFESWFLDAGDFIGYGVNPREGRVAPESWYRVAAEKLQKTPVKDRLLGMAKHMARFFLLKPDVEMAHLFSALYEEAEQNFLESTLLLGVLRKTVAETPPMDAALALLDSEMTFGHTDLRRLIRTEFFSNLKHPKGLHLARLDFTEVAFISLESAMLILPGEKRPREESKYAIAFEIAKTFTNTVAKDTKESIENNIDRLANRIGVLTNLKKGESKTIVSTVVEKLICFYDEICSNCSVGCIYRPTSRMNEHFFSLQHPAEDLFDKTEGQGESKWHHTTESDDVEYVEWNPLELDDPVDEDEQCPCGSGKTYRTCCKFN